MDDLNIDDLLDGIFDSSQDEQDASKQSKNNAKQKNKGNKNHRVSSDRNIQRARKGSTTNNSGRKLNQSSSNVKQNGTDEDDREETERDVSKDVSPGVSRNTRVSPGKVVYCVFLGLVMSFIFFIIVGSIYTNRISYPPQEEVVYELTGAYALDMYESAVHSQKEVAGDNYLLAEITYCNSNEHRLNFIKRVVETVEYFPKIVVAKNIYGNDMIDKTTKETVGIPSYVYGSEDVYFSYIDYETLDFPSSYLRRKISEYDLNLDNVSYATILVDMFCDCVSETDDLPIKTVLRKPNLIKDGDGYSMTGDEDIYLDNLLFSSSEFNECQVRFAEKVGKILSGSELKLSEEWVFWSRLSSVNRSSMMEPYKYGKLSMLRNWCGAYYLKNEAFYIDSSGNKVHDIIKPQLGDGTSKNPASINTPLVSYVLDNGKKIPIEVTLLEFGVSEDALVWFQSKHVQNRGYNLESEIQYYYAVFSIKNLSSEELVVKDNSSLSDINKNLASRTGTVFGLNDELTLKSDESGIIETWGRSTELYKKYLIWGADFEKQIEPLWFRVLAGDLEDTSYDKGVHIINKSRLGSDADLYVEEEE